MKVFILLFSLLILSGCSASVHIDNQNDDWKPKIGRCYKYSDEAIKLVGIDNNTYYYKHSWNEQTKIFENDISIFKGREIPCFDSENYEMELLIYRIHSLEMKVNWLERLVKDKK